MLSHGTSLELCFETTQSNASFIQFHLFQLFVSRYEFAELLRFQRGELAKIRIGKIFMTSAVIY